MCNSRLSNEIRDEKKNMFKKILKEKLNLNNLFDLVLIEKNYNGGMFGCI